MIVEQEKVEELEEGEEFTNLDAPDEELGQVEEEIEQAPQFEVPDKFKDKNIEDVVKAYQELEKSNGRQAQEVGDLRRLSDELLQLQLKEKQETVQPVKELDVDSLLENPTEAINTAVNPRLEALEDRFIQAERSQSKALFEKKHPDSIALIQDPTFQNFINSSKVRQRMFQEADANYDYETADELFSMYKEIHGAKQEELQEKATQKRSKKLKAAKTETGSTGATSTKVYRRADLMNMRLKDPARYEAMEDEFMQAYAEGRVK